jgi:hypothetical protein
MRLIHIVWRSRPSHFGPSPSVDPVMKTRDMSAPAAMMPQAMVMAHIGTSEGAPRVPWSMASVE